MLNLVQVIRETQTQENIFQVCKADVEEYTGECEPPPAIVAIIIAESDKITPPDLTVEATINGLRNSVTIELKEEAQNVIECVCQVFYHKLGFPNHWRATFSFFPKVHEKVTIDIAVKLL